MRRSNVSICLLALLFLTFRAVSSQTASPHRAFNHSEEQIPPYTEPDILKLDDGKIVTTAAQWRNERRPEILRQLQSEMFGFQPATAVHLKLQHRSSDPVALDGLATRVQATLVLPNRPSGPALHILLYLPNRIHTRVPVFLGLNDAGNQSVTDDPGVDLNQIWIPSPADRHVLVPSQATDATRATRTSQWPVKTILARGYGFATIYAGDLEPDFKGGNAYGFSAALSALEASIPPRHRWGALAVWAWGLSRALDYLRTARRVDGAHVAVIGHSRFGKAALWAGAQDERFGMVISNESGKGGAALMRRDYGETIENLTTRFSYWFCPSFQQYAADPQAIPFDSPFILSLVAPRPLYVASSDGEFIVDPKGEFLAARAVQPVYGLFNKTGLNLDQMPAIDTPVTGQIGYHIRQGRHDMTAYDWAQYLNFADQHFATK